MAAVLVPVGQLPWANATETSGPGWRSWLRGNVADVTVHPTGGGCRVYPTSMANGGAGTTEGSAGSPLAATALHRA